MEFALGLLAGLCFGIGIGILASGPLKRLDDEYIEDMPPYDEYFDAYFGDEEPWLKEPSSQKQEFIRRMNKADRHDGGPDTTTMGFEA